MQKVKKSMRKMSEGSAQEGATHGHIPATSKPPNRKPTAMATKRAFCLIKFIMMGPEGGVSMGKTDILPFKGTGRREKRGWRGKRGKRGWRAKRGKRG